MTEDNKTILAEIILKYEALEPLIAQAKKILTLDSQNWPKAKPENQVYKNMDKWELMFDALKRASNISQDTQGKKVLFIGCDDPFLPDHYAAEADIVVSYNRKFTWQKFNNHKDNLFFTDNMQELRHRGPYDLVIYWDILDHYFEDYVSQTHEISESLIENQKHLLELGKFQLSEAGKIFIRFHPWFSRHGGHLKDNLAYNHLFITDERYDDLLEDRNLVAHRIYDPIAYYKRLINSVKPAAIEFYVRENRPEEDLAVRLVGHIKSGWPTNIPDEALIDILSIEYVDCLLTF